MGVDTAHHIRVGRAVSVLQRWSSNFYHWLLECVPRLVVLMKSGALRSQGCRAKALADDAREEGDPIHLLVPGSPDSQRFVDETLRILGIHDQQCVRVIRVVDGLAVHAEALVTVDWHYQLRGARPRSHRLH